MSTTQLERRLENTERALAGLWAIIEDLHPDYIQENVNSMIENYVISNTSLGSQVMESVEFKNSESEY